MAKYFITIVVLTIIFSFAIFFYNKNKTMKKSVDNIAKISTEDAELKKYKDTAQSQIDYLIKFMNDHDKDDTLFRYAVKSSFHEDGLNEHMWAQVNEFKDTYFLGRLANVPSTLKQIKYGDKVKVYKLDVEDWILQDFTTNTEVGGFSRKYMRSKEK
jgi:uncharacterized protein YegJ (DUF2314 family)